MPIPDEALERRIIPRVLATTTTVEELLHLFNEQQPNQHEYYAVIAIAPDRVVPLSRYQVGKWYPFASRVSFRIDDPKTSWKGKGLWTASASRATWHLEGGKGTRPKLVKLQLRPNPLAQ